MCVSVVRTCPLVVFTIDVGVQYTQICMPISVGISKRSTFL